MIVGSLLLILVAVTLLVFGLAGGSSALLIASIVASLLAAVALVVGARQAAARTLAADDPLLDPRATDPGADPGLRRSTPDPADLERAAAYAAAAPTVGLRRATVDPDSAVPATGFAPDHVDTPDTGRGAAPSDLGSDENGTGHDDLDPEIDSRPDGLAAAADSRGSGRDGLRAETTDLRRDGSGPAADGPGFDRDGSRFERDGSGLAADGSGRDGAGLAADGSGRDGAGLAADGSGRDGSRFAADGAGFERDGFGSGDSGSRRDGSGSDDLGIRWGGGGRGGFAPAQRVDDPTGSFVVHRNGGTPASTGTDRLDEELLQTPGGFHPGRPGAADLDEPAADDPADEPAPQRVSPADAAHLARTTVEVLVVDGRPRYHLAGCPHLNGRDTEPVPVAEAIDLGFTPCGRCRPVDRLVVAPRPV
jgi:clumping factor A